MLPASWKPVESTNLVRMGSDLDGGYVVATPAIKASGLLISMGLSDNWDFEADFRKVGNARIVCLDHTINTRFWLRHAIARILTGQFSRLGRYFSYRRFFGRSGVEHRQLKVGYDGSGGVSLETLVAKEPLNSVFLKADIEGSEYRIFDDIARYADRLTGIAIEFHDIDLHRDRINKLFKSLPDFSIVALAANNFGGVDNEGDPIVIEVTLIRKDFVSLGAGQKFEAVTNDPSHNAIEPVYASSAV